MQHDSHIHRRQRWIVGRACVARIATMPPELTNDGVAAWLRAMEAALRIQYSVPGAINIVAETQTQD